MKNIFIKFFVPVFMLSGSMTSLCSFAEDIEEVVVTGSPFEKNTDQVNHPVTVLTNDQLHQAAASTLGETLSNELGVSSASFGPGVGLPVIRGQSDNRVKVMQDSVGSMDASAASPDHAVTLEPLLADRIEILRGPAALRYGSGAIGGVVNVIDNRIPTYLPKKNIFGMELRSNLNNDETDSVFSLTAPINQMAFYVDALWRDNGDTRIPGFALTDPQERNQFSKGYIENTSAQSRAFSLGSSYFYDSGFVGVSVNHLDNNYGVPPDSEQKVRIDLHQTRLDLKGEQTELSGFFNQLTWHMGAADYKHTEMEDGVPGTVFLNHAFEGRVELIEKADAEEKNASQLATGLQYSHSLFSALGEEAFIPKSLTQSFGIFVLQDWTANQFSTDFGARYDREVLTPDNQTLYGSAQHFDTLNLSATAGWHFSEHQKVSVSLAHSQRAPSVEELMADGPHPATQAFLVGDAKLKPETSDNIDLGYHWHSEQMETSVSVYRNQVSDYIFAANQHQLRDDLNLYQYTQADAVFAGYEVEFKYFLSAQLETRIFSDTVKATFAQSGNYLPRIPPQRIGNEWIYTKNQWDFKALAIHAFAQNHPGDNEASTAAYSRLDLFFNYHVDVPRWHYLYFIKITNVTNAEIRNATSYLRDLAPEAGRALTVGLQLKY